jgi:hypothetical protein
MKHFTRDELRALLTVSEYWFRSCHPRNKSESHWAG